MTGWRIEPAGLTKILTDTATAVENVGTALNGVAETPADVKTGGGYDGIVSTAFNEFLQETFDGAITRMFANYSSALEGTANAANAYLAGDEEVAATLAAGIGASDFDATYGSSGGGQ